MGEFKLISEILTRSDSNSWEMAKSEWKLSDIYFSDEPETCLCGHNPILELCEIENVKNGNIATVGNICVKKFVGLPSDRIFQAVKKVKKNIEKSLNGDALELAYSNSWINKWEFDFYSYTFRKRKLSPRQLTKKKQINEKILTVINRNKPR